MSGPVRTPARRAMAITLSAGTAHFPANVFAPIAFCFRLSEPRGHAARMGSDCGPTHADDPLEQATRERTRLQIVDSHRAGRLADQRDVGGIAAECGNVPLDPLQHDDLIEKSPVAAGVVRRFRGQCRRSKEPEDP